MYPQQPHYDPAAPYYMQPIPPKKGRKGLIISLASVGAAVLVGGAFFIQSTSKSAESNRIAENPDKWYTAQSRLIFPGDETDNDTVISLGHTMCDKLDNGESLKDLEGYAGSTDISYEQVDQLARAAVKAYCPSNASKVN